MNRENVKRPYGFMKIISDFAGALTRLGFLALIFKYVYLAKGAFASSGGVTESYYFSSHWFC